MAAAELSQPSFYRAWPSKEAAYSSIIDSTNALWQAAADTSLKLSTDLPLVTALERGVGHLFDVLTTDMDLTRLVLRHNSQTDQHSLYVPIYTQRFRELQASRVIGLHHAPELLAQVYTALTERFLYARLLTGDATSQQAAHELMSVLLPLLLAEDGLS